MRWGFALLFHFRNRSKLVKAQPNTSDIVGLSGVVSCQLTWFLLCAAHTAYQALSSAR